MKEQQNLRRTDFWTGLGLAVLAVAMLAGASRFPISASYGGVQNVWYVSPALFPLIVGTGVLVLSLILMVTAVRSVGTEKLREALALKFAGFGPREQRFAMIVAAIVGFVYVMVPAVDFFLATALFLLVFMAAFHLPDSRGLMPNLYVYLALLVLVVAGRVIGVGEVSGFSGGLDIVVLVGIAAAILVNVRIAGADALARRRLRRVLYVVAVTPTVLCIFFRYGLLVPLPHEGVVMNLMEAVRYAFRS